VLAAVGPLQFDVVAAPALSTSFGAKSELSHLDYEIARLTDEGRRRGTGRSARGPRWLTRRLDGALLALFRGQVAAQRHFSGTIRRYGLDPLLAGTAV